jgi:lysophospholipase L1-like esterase
LVAVGNSITEGAGLTPTQNYPAVLRATLGATWQVFNCGHSSWTTAQLIGNFPEFQSKFANHTSRNIMVVNEVSNEIDQGVSEATAKANMRTLIAMGRAGGWKVFFATTTPRDAGHFSAGQNQACANINDFFRNNPSERDGFIDWAADSHLSDPTNATYYQDGVHPTAAGAAVMAALTNTAITA